jgi:hypothetical protein
MLGSFLLKKVLKIVQKGTFYCQTNGRGQILDIIDKSSDMIAKARHLFANVDNP